MLDTDLTIALGSFRCDRQLWTQNSAPALPLAAARSLPEGMRVGYLRRVMP
jgi:hypothetical protein